MIRKLLDWFDHRTGYREKLNEALYERIPGGARWRYVWGSTLVFTFTVQVITGIFLWSAYSPSTFTAWESVYYIQEMMFLGSVVRGIHHYSAQLMVVLLGIHLMQVVIDGAYRAPREVNFWLGLILMQIVLGLALTGYLLPWDQKGYYATKVSTNIMGATPIIGQQLQELAQGGPSYGHHTLTRFFAMHAGILPGLLVAFLVLHIYVFRRHGVTVRDPQHAPETTFWPDQVLRDSVACLGVLAVILLLAIFRSAEISAPADVSEPYAAARPEWYFLFLFQFLRFEAVEHFGLAFGAIYVPSAIMTVVVLMPFIALCRGGHRFNVVFVWMMAVAITGLTGLAFYVDSQDANHQAAIAEADRDAHRVRELAPQQGIPPAGAVTLLRSDPYTQGPRLFAKHCAMCHRYNGHDGRGRLVMESIPDPDNPGRTVKVVAWPQAADLGTFRTREWMRSVLTDYENHFSAFRDAAWFQAAQQLEATGKSVAYLDPEYSEMADWSGEKDDLGSPENLPKIDALVEFLVQQAGAKDVDEDLAAQGLALATQQDWSGTAVSDSSEATCASCHSTIGQAFVDVPDDKADGYPNLSGYGSSAWLRSFVADPEAAQHYGEKNRMPEYADRVTEQELDLLVRWMTGDFETDTEDYPSLTERLQAMVQQRRAGAGSVDE